MPAASNVHLLTGCTAADVSNAIVSRQYAMPTPSTPSQPVAFHNHGLKAKTMVVRKARRAPVVRRSVVNNETVATD